MNSPLNDHGVPPGSRATRLLSFTVVLASVVLSVGVLAATPVRGDDDATRCVAIELYVRNDNPACKLAEATLKQFVAEKQGVQLRTYNLDEPGKHVEQYQRIVKYFGVKEPKLPVVYSCKYLLTNMADAKRLKAQVEATLAVNVFVRAGCLHCAAAKSFLEKLKPRYPGFAFNFYDISDRAALQRMEKLATRYRQKAASLPAIHFCNGLSIGYIDDDTTGRRLEATFKFWTVPCAKPKTEPKQPSKNDEPSPDSAAIDNVPSDVFFTAFSTDAGDSPQEDNGKCLPQSTPGDLPDSPVPPEDGSLAPGPPPPGGSPPRPQGAKETSSNDGDERSPPPEEFGNSIRVPVFGKLNLNQLGMPAFTFLVGLVDGFNPCAMWVLLFLLSVLVNLKSRIKMLAVAGTFVVISGVAYFAFMAAWLTVFQLASFEGGVQVTLGVIAVLIGAIHIKDFFAFKKGISLSIPESAKPGIYARVRKIVTAQSLYGAIAGAVVLAVLVNLLELLCTAGLPALYTKILTMQNYPRWKNYAYLGLYNVAYMLDDMLMVGIVVVTLGRHKLQERGGRWLKLISGVAIAVLGIVMIAKPEWLV